MRIILLIVFLNLSIISHSQVFVIDRGSEEIEKLNTAVSTLAWMEMNKPDKIKEYLSQDSKVDLTNLEMECNYVSENFPFDDVIPVFFSNNEKDFLWYQRTYYKKTEKDIEYLFQIHIRLLIEEGKSKIANIKFLRNDKIEDINEYVAKLEIMGKNFIPPPPPAPGGLPVKH